MSSIHANHVDFVNCFDSYVDSIPWQLIEEAILPSWNDSRLQYINYIESLKAEARFGLKLIHQHLKENMRVLEVGSGSGLLASFLASQNIEITALEPGLGGFSINVLLSQELKKYLSTNSPNIQNNLTQIYIPSQELKAKEHGKFDLIYSINVLEHIPPLKSSLIGMYSVLKEEGVMVHTCPNYHIPYEPHLGIFLLPFIPQSTVFLFPRLRRSGLWNSLNFITSTSLRNMCRLIGCEIKFQSGVMYDTFLRLDEDQAFKSRQGNLTIMGIYSFLKKIKIFNLIKYLPPDIQTPMIVSISKPCPSNGRVT